MRFLSNYLKSKIDTHTIEVINKSLLAAIVKVSSLLINIGISVFIARKFGASGFGIIDLSNRIATISVVLAMFGFESIIVRKTAIASTENNNSVIASNIYSALSLSLPMAIVLALIGIVLNSTIVNNIFQDQALSIPICCAFLMIIPMSISKIYAAALNGIGKIWQSNLVNEALNVWIVGLGLLVLHLLDYPININNIVIGYLVARILVSVIVKIYWSSLFIYKGEKKLVTHQLLKLSLPLLFVSTSTIIISNSSTILLGWLEGTKDVGLYAVAVKLAVLISFILHISNTAISPKLASLYSVKKIPEMRLLVRRITTLLSFLAAFFFIFYLFAGRFVLEFWGTEFVEANNILLILTLGQVFNMATGCTGMLLVMCGFERVIGKITLYSFLITITLNVLFIYHFGVWGAAIATSLGVIVENVLKVIAVKKFIGIVTVPFFYFSNSDHKKNNS